MRTILTTLFCLLFISVLARSQYAGRVQHPLVPSARLAGTFRVTIYVENSSQSRNSDEDRGVLSDDKKGWRLSQMICVWSVSGNNEYTLDPDSLSFTGEGPWDTENSIVELYDLLAKAAVAEGIALGYTPCSSNCIGTGVPIVRVYQPSCVQRTGTGSATRLIPQDPAVLCNREYVVCCPNGIATPTITPILHEGVGCSGAGYEPTCR